MSDESAGGVATTTTATGASAPAEKTFTQEQVNRIIDERLARERAKLPDLDDLRAKATRLDELEASTQSDAEKLRQRAERAELKATAREEAAATRETNAQTMLKRAAVIAEATAQRAVNPETVFKLLDADKLTIGDDGQVAGVKEAVKGLLEAEKYLVGGSAPQPVPGAFGGGPQNGPAPVGASMDQVIRQVAGFGQ